MPFNFWRNHRMYIQENSITYSPSDLTLYMDSPFASWMEHLALTNPELLPSQDEEDQLMAVLQHKGIQHENEILDSFLEKNLNITQISKGPNAQEDTFSAMQSGADIIYQAALSVNPFKGYADFLVKVEGKSNLGNYYYEIWDTKLAKTVKPYFIIQLCCYADMLETLQGRRPDHIVVVLGNSDQARLNTTNFFYYYKNLKHQFLQTHEAFSPQKMPDPANSNSCGRWSNYAEESLKKADHLSQVATIIKSQIKKLNKVGIHTMLDLVESDLDRIKGMNTDVLTRLKSQARIQNASVGKDVPLYQILPHDIQKKMGLSLLPYTSLLDIYFDIEGFPLEDGGLEYLWGVVYFDENGTRQYKDFWAHVNHHPKGTFSSSR